MKLPIENPEFFAKGKRGHLFKGKYKGLNVVVKTTNPNSKAIDRIKNECNFVKKLNKKRIGPKLIKCVDEEMMYEFVPGDFIEDYCKKSSKKEILRIIQEVFEQCFIMDKIGVNKEEMHHPYKHVICKRKEKPVMLDFERCHNTLKPKNVTQFCQYMVSSKLTYILADKNISFHAEQILGLARDYKKDRSRKNFDLILDNFK